MSASSSSSSYYDLDAILSEEELVPCWTNFDFSYLATLDPDHHFENNDPSTSTTTQLLAASTKLKMPIWAVTKWAALGYVKMVLPRIYGRKAREKLQADPLQVDLSKRNEHYFGTGVALVELWDHAQSKLRGTTVPRAQRRQWQQQLDQLQSEAQALRTSLVAAYTGERLRRTMDWSWSAWQDDVTQLTDQLTAWEWRLFLAGATAVQHDTAWQQQGKRRSIRPRATAATDTVEMDDKEGESPSKRARLE